jgi:putative transposase
MAGFLRKANRLSQPSYRGQRSYFLTICSNERKKIFTDSKLVLALLDLLEEKCLAHSFGVYAYCFMPDHLHLVLVGRGNSANLALVIRAFKGAATSRARPLGAAHLWQKGFYDHVIRSGEGMDAVAWYIFTNPVRAGLVKHFDEWPFSVSLMFDWKKRAGPPEPFVPPWKKPLAG